MLLRPVWIEIGPTRLLRKGPHMHESILVELPDRFGQYRL